MRHTLWIAAFAMMASLTSSADAGLFFKKKCDSDCDTCCNEPECCPEDYRCTVKVESEPIEKSCYRTESKAICIPPITTSPFDCFKKKLCGKNGCDDCCDTACCDTPCCDSCDGGCCKKGGLFSCFKGHSCGKIRCVKKLSKEKYECGEKCVCEWSAEYVGSCCGDGCGDSGCCDKGCCDTCAAPAGCCPIR